MKKLLLSFLLIFFSFSSLFAQRDTDHWFAPYFDASNSNYIHTLYLSTDNTTPFPVNIYSNNNIIGTVTISKGAPQAFTVPSQFMQTRIDSDAYNPISLGLYTKGDRPYFASLRMAVSSHGEIVTSKGKAGIGTTFFAAATPVAISSSSMNFTTGILATEDNTSVTVSGYDPNVQFINNTTTTATVTFTLNKGQSYILSGKANIAANRSGFIGSKIVSTKPISVTNGNSNSIYTTAGTSAGSDLVLDQSVPVERLGNEFAMVRSISVRNSDNLEGGIIIATENGTQIFLNNEPNPVATLSAGEFYRILDEKYILQANGHYNIYVRATKNIYLYQLVGGSATGSPQNTGGYNYIPPLNCFLPRKIDEIGLVNEMPGSASAITLKLNILTEVGATVLVNGIAPTAAQGPYPLTGNTNWVTYALTGVTGNLTITSTKAVTAGINGGYSSAGYGGYFAGFSSIPLIAKQTGDCIPGLVLEVDDSYETYQWFRNDVPITGANSNSFTPTTSGNYTVRITVGSCVPVTTPPYKVYTCLQESTDDITVCEGYLDIVPQFTTSPQTYAPGSVQIITPPNNGTATINPTTGVIGYVPTYGFVGTDTITYKFCGNVADFVDCEQITLTLTIAASPVVQNATLRTCYLPANVATGLFDLSTATVTLEAGVTYNYYPSLTDANNGTNEINNPTAYTAPNGVVYVRVSNATGCFRVAVITLVVFPPTFSTVLEDKIICIEDRTTLDAGPGFDYIWSTGALTQTISNVGVGVYWVDLKSGDCITRQHVKVYASEQPVITNVDISTNNITVNVVGGTAPYQYSIDNITWQDSNIFTTLPRGDVKIYVKDSYNCVPLEVGVTIPNIINVITPNSDGINDILDYSALANKPNLVFGIFDRYGNRIHQGTKDNGYTWDGTTNGSKKVATGNYWYNISWNENTINKTAVKYSGWILVKNRE